MRLRHVVILLAASLATFVACGARLDTHTESADDAGPTVLSDAVDVLKDTFGIDISPEKDAHAAPPATTTSASYDKSDPIPMATGTYHYAEVAVLAGTTAIVCGAPAQRPPDYSCTVSAVHVRDGAVELRDQRQRDRDEGELDHVHHPRAVTSRCHSYSVVLPWSDARRFAKKHGLFDALEKAAHDPLAHGLPFRRHH